MCSAESSITSPRSTGKLVGQKGSKRLSNEPSVSLVSLSRNAARRARADQCASWLALFSPIAAESTSRTFHAQSGTKYRLHIRCVFSGCMTRCARADAPSPCLSSPQKGQNLPAVADGEALCRQVFQAAKAGDSERLEGLLLLGAPVNYTEVRPEKRSHQRAPFFLRSLSHSLGNINTASGYLSCFEAGQRWPFAPAPQVGTTVLHAAAASGNLETVRLLIKAGAPPQTVAPGGVTILHEAARGGAKDVVDIVLAAGLSPNVVDSVRSDLLLHLLTLVSSALRRSSRRPPESGLQH